MPFIKKAAITSLLIVIVAAEAFAVSPVDADLDSIATGAQLYKQYCTECHGSDGRAQMDVIADATDLTDPVNYYNGRTDEDMFNSIKNGAGVAMPPWSFQIKNDEDIWHLVNFIRSLWPENQTQDEGNSVLNSSVNLGEQ